MHVSQQPGLVNCPLGSLLISTVGTTYSSFLIERIEVSDLFDLAIPFELCLEIAFCIMESLFFRAFYFCKESFSCICSPLGI